MVMEISASAPYIPLLPRRRQWVPLMLTSIFRTFSASTGRGESVSPAPILIPFTFYVRTSYACTATRWVPLASPFRYLRRISPLPPLLKRCQLIVNYLPLLLPAFPAKGNFSCNGRSSTTVVSPAMSTLPAMVVSPAMASSPAMSTSPVIAVNAAMAASCSAYFSNGLCTYLE